MVAVHRHSDLLQGCAPIAHPPDSPRFAPPSRSPVDGIVPGQRHSRPLALAHSRENHRLELIGKNTEDGVNSMWLQVNLAQHGLQFDVNEGNTRWQVELLQSVFKPTEVILELRRS